MPSIVYANNSEGGRIHTGSGCADSVGANHRRERREQSGSGRTDAECENFRDQCKIHGASNLIHTKMRIKTPRNCRVKPAISRV